MKALDIPILQGLCLTSSREEWEASDEGVTPLDSANQIAIPEFDGRIITAPFSFKEIDEDGLPRYVADAERCARVAGIAVNHARLRHVPPAERKVALMLSAYPTKHSRVGTPLPTPLRHVPAAERKVALMLSAYPTKHSRVGNAVGLDTPVSAIRLLRRMRDEGYDLGPADGEVTRFLDDGRRHRGRRRAHPRADRRRRPGRGVAHRRAAHRQPRPDQRRRLPALDRRPPGRPDGRHRRGVGRGARHGCSSTTQNEIVLATLQAGNVVLLIQPPRGFGENPVAIYHDPDLAPSHHYLAAYRWLEHGFGAHAVVHLGKHGSMEWLPGKNAALSASCATDAAIGNLPLIYPFLVNDPGEGAQAKRRAHATIVDHLIPPMARAESYGDIARLEQLLDEHANIAAMDPAKLPAIRAEIWTLMHAAEMHRDLGLDERPDDEEFDDFILHVDGWLCEIKDAQIRDGLHVLGQAPDGEARVNLVLAILRAAQVWGGEARRGARPARGARADGGRRAVRRRRRHRGRRPASLVERDGEGRLGAAPRPTTCTTTPTVAAGARASPPSRSCRGWPAPPTSSTPCCTPSTAASSRPDRPARRCAAWSTCCRPAATSTPSTRAPSRRGWPTRPASAMADSLLRALPRRDRRATRARSASRSGARQRDADVRRRHRRGARAARRPARVGRGVAPGQRPRRRPARRAGPPADRRHRAHLRLLPRRLPARRRDARRRGPAGRRARRAGRAELRPRPRRRPTSPSTATSVAPPRASSARSPGSYGAGILQVVESGNWRDDDDLAEVYTAVGRLRLRPRPRRRAGRRRHARQLPAHRRSRPRTSTPASTTSPTPTTTSSTTAAWSPPSAR